MNLEEIYAEVGSDGSIVIDSTAKQLLSYRAGEKVIIRFTTENKEWELLQAIKTAQSLEAEPVVAFLSSCNSASSSEELSSRLRLLL
jgi:hypothetical protein